jgi:hypothetical protein
MQPPQTNPDGLNTERLKLLTGNPYKICVKPKGVCSICQETVFPAQSTNDAGDHIACAKKVN